MPVKDFNLADKTLLEKKVRTTYLPSQKIKQWNEKIKDASLFSARTTRKAYLEEIKAQLAKVASREIIPLVAEKNLKATLAKLGYTPSGHFPGDIQHYHGAQIPPAIPGSMQDLSSSRRIQLILDVNQKQARAMGQMALSEDPKRIKYFPAWRLRRANLRRKPRADWAKRWKAAGESVGWEGACRDQMVALKNSPIWQALGDGVGGFMDTLGSPFPPFAFGSGLGWKDVGRAEAEKLGLDVSKAQPVVLKENPARKTQDEPENPGFTVEEAKPTEETGEEIKAHEEGMVIFHPDTHLKDEALGELAKIRAEIKALRDYANKALDEAKKTEDAVLAAVTGYDQSIWGSVTDACTKDKGSILGCIGDVTSADTAAAKMESKIVGMSVPVDEDSQGNFDYTMDFAKKWSEKTRTITLKDKTEQINEALKDLGGLEAEAKRLVEDWKVGECKKTEAEAKVWVDKMHDGQFEALKEQFRQIKKGKTK